MEKIIVQGCYGELYDPDSMVYINARKEEVEEVLKVTVHPDFRDRLQTMMYEIDNVVRRHMEVI